MTEVKKKLDQGLNFMAENVVAIAFMILDVWKILLDASQKKLPFRFSGKAI